MQTATMNTKVNIWLVCSALCASLVRATQSVCSSQNTATTDGVREQFQSNGWCSNNCAGHQFAVVQGYMCWCSDSEPSTQTSVGNCSGACPGYGYEECGNADENLFGYIYLGQTPLSSIQSVETSTAPSTSSASISTASSSLTTLDTTSLSATTTAPVPTSTGATSSISAPTSTTSSTSTPASTTSLTSTPAGTTSLTSTSTSTISSTSTPTSTSSSTSTLTRTISSTSTPITFTSTSPTSTSIASSMPVSSSSASAASSSTTSSTTTSSIPASTSSTTVAYTSTTAAPTTSIITSVNLQTSLKYSVITVTSVHTMDANVSEITSRYLTTTKIITQVYSSAPTETPISVATTTSVGVGGRITNSNGNSNSNSNNNNTNNNNNVPTNKSTGKKGYWHSPGKIAATFVVVGVVCLAIICVLIYLIYHYRTRPARKAQDFENAYQSKFSQSKYPNKTATATSATLHTPSPSSSSTFSTPRLIYTDEKGQITSESPSSRQSTYSLTAGSPLNDPSTLASPFRDPTLSRRASTFLHSPPTQKHHDKIESNIALGEDAVLVDQRLDPSKMLSTIASDDATNHSNISLSDNVDYSRRVLRVMNE